MAARELLQYRQFLRGFNFSLLERLGGVQSKRAVGVPLHYLRGGHFPDGQENFMTQFQSLSFHNLLGLPRNNLDRCKLFPVATSDTVRFPEQLLLLPLLLLLLLATS